MLSGQPFLSGIAAYKFVAIHVAEGFETHTGGAHTGAESGFAHHARGYTMTPEFHDVSHE
ncbi:hypothetical protein BBSC_1138 [Bifidobacterium scardovii JCM 12489 = DSM 13734]|nr:hypothetical protein BBSC_1138 [Bifidobacterium scardovii JCM 12489 = DSM 13734]